MSIPFIDLKSQYKLLEKDINEQIQNVLEHGQYIMGPEVAELEKQLAEFCGAKHAITCSSGTDALSLGLMAYDVGPGDAVFTTPFTFFATAEVIALVGATPVFVDIDPKTFNIDPVKLAEAVEDVKAEGKLKVRGVMPVNLFGLCPDFDAINAIAKSNDMFVLEDTAQGFGGTYNGKVSGSLGDISATSFFPAKPLGCYGDGGAVFTDNDELADKIKSIRVHGKGTDKYDNIRIGLNARMDTLQAGIMLPKLNVFGNELKSRAAVAKEYSEALGDVVETPYTPEGYTSAWAQYSILTDSREKIQAALKVEGIPSVVYYPVPCHLSGAFEYLDYKKGDFPVSEHTATKIMSLPMHPYLESEQIQKITNVIKSAI